MTLSFLLSNLVGGLMNGSLYVLIALALVLIYRTTVVANFAQGDMGMFSVFILLMVILPIGVPLPLAWLLTVAFGAGMGSLIYLLAIRPKQDAGHLNVTIRTLGVYSLLYAVAVYLWSSREPYQVPSLFGRDTVSALGFSISYDQLGAIGVTATLSATLFLFFRYSSAGLATKAVAINPEIAALLGVNVGRVSLLVWVVGGAMAATVGLLLAPISFIESNLMRPYILKGFTAAIMGGLTSFAGAVAGGLILGTAEALAVLFLTFQFRDTFVFAVLLLVLLVRPAGLFGRVHKGRV